MRLKSLDIHGFKSFPDKTRLEFGAGVTCVVGPNGSGKSNVSDAVRWVLGEQSTKQLRGSKMEDVIFSGTDQRRALGLAEVTLHLDNTDRCLNNCDADAVSVTRRLYRSGESDYLINGKTCRLKDVHELFMDTGLGRDGYTLVGQGRVQELVSSHSAQRRDMLEEAAGISQSRYRREAALKKLDQAEENLLRLRDILLELEGRVEPLRVQKEKAEVFLQLAERRKMLEIGLALHIIAQSVETLREQDHKITKAKAEYGLCEQELERLDAESQALQAQAQEFTLRAEALRRERAALEEEATRQGGEIAVLENTIEHNNSAAQRLEQDRTHAAETRQQLAEQLEALQDELLRLRTALEEQHGKGNALTKNVNEIVQQTEDLARQGDALAIRREALTQAISGQQVAQSSAQSSEGELRQRLESIERANAGRLEQRKELEENLTRAREAFTQQQAEIESLQNALQGHQLRMQSRSAKARDAQRGLEQSRGELQQKQSRGRLLEDLEQNMEGYSGSVKAVMKESHRGSLSGLHGTLSQLITVAPEYALAAETALGASLQFLVCDAEADAKRAIEFLKRSNAGRATFLPLHVIKGQELHEKGLEGCAGFVALASELVEADPQYKQILLAQLGRTAVAEDMESAIAIARSYGQRFRIVTLDGQVINAGGSMSGGSRAQGAGMLSRGAEIARLKEECRALQAQLEEQQKRSKLLTEEAAAAEAAVTGVQGDLARALEESIRQEGQAAALELRLADAAASQAELEHEKTAAAQRIALLTAECTAAAGETGRLEAALQETAQAQTELQQKRAALEAGREQLAEAESAQRMALLATEKDIEAREEAAALLRERHEGHAGRDSDLLAEQETLRQNNLEVEEAIRVLRESIAALRKEAEDGQSGMEAALAQREETMAKAETFRREEKLLAERKEKLGGELARQEERRAVTRQELDAAGAKLFHEYQLTPREAETQGYKLENPMQAQIELTELSAKIRALGNINVDAIEEYKEVAERFTFMAEQVEDVERSREELIRLIHELTGQMGERFREQFVRINRYFGETFAELFSGGLATLELEDPEDVLECAIEIRVQPPGKNVQNIDLLSGGEKGLAAIALLFAILKATPAPFCIFDEVEAALDDVNVGRFARYVRRMTRNTQFILISHRRGTMEEADVLYGVTMQEEGVSKLLEMKTKEMAGKLGIL
ncbi:MAG: chromosome segregation protein SMC [Oscillospiraceae bacterium]|jgi:chromosome segregation protein|nr:chromosome segregation protein SMC [Oscillospiraceae bacterium]